MQRSFRGIIVLTICLVPFACVSGSVQDVAEEEGFAERGGSTSRGGTSHSAGAQSGSHQSGGSASKGGSTPSNGSGGTSNSSGGTNAGKAGTGGGAGTGGTNACNPKRGLACGFSVASAPADIAALAAPSPGVGWFYNWRKTPSSELDQAYIQAGVEWVPMIWGGADELDDPNLADKIRVAPNTKYLLGYNEPNFHSQANLTPERAAQAWPNVEKAAAQLGLETVGPAVNFCGGGCNETDPFVWLDRFLAACSGCRIDYLAFHSYACEFEWFKNEYMKRAVDKYFKNGSPPRKIWLTEFACQDNAPPDGWPTASISSYMRSALDYLENEPGIFRYAWFADNTGRCRAIHPNNDLLGGPGALTPLGQTYTGEPGTCR